MDKVSTLVALVMLSLSSGLVHATPTDVTPPTQIQKDKVPDSTSNGNYLEPQPDENGATTENSSGKHQKKGSKPTNIEKSKKVTEPPENGGAKVK